MDSAPLPAAPLSVDVVTNDLQARVREQIRQDLLRHGASRTLTDPGVFADLEALMRGAVSRSHHASLLLPELLGDPHAWRLDTAMRYGSHRGGAVAKSIVFVKQRLMMPIVRWLFEYSRDNFERQQHVNDVLFACVQELAIENARLRRDLERLSAK